MGRIMGMKKIIVIILIFCTTLLTACSTDIVGSWKANAVSYDGKEQEYDEYIKSLEFDKDEESDITVKFTSDGKYNFSMMGEPLSGKWEEKDGKYVLDFSGNEIEAELDGSRLSIKLGMVVFIFKKD